MAAALPSGSSVANQRTTQAEEGCVEGEEESLPSGLELEEES